MDHLSHALRLAPGPHNDHALAHPLYEFARAANGPRPEMDPSMTSARAESGASYVR